MMVATVLDGHSYVLVEKSPGYSIVLRDGEELPRFRLQYEATRTRKKAGHVGVPTAEIALKHLRHAHEELCGNPA